MSTVVQTWSVCCRCCTSTSCMSVREYSCRLAGYTGPTLKSLANATSRIQQARSRRARAPSSAQRPTTLQSDETDSWCRSPGRGGMRLHPGMCPVWFLVCYHHRPCVFSCVLLPLYAIKHRFTPHSSLSETSLAQCCFHRLIGTLKRGLCAVVRCAFQDARVTCIRTTMPNEPRSYPTTGVC